MTKQVALKIIYFQENQGHGNARRKSLSECSNSLVALMDSDDICIEDRFEKQLKEFLNNDRLSVVGGLISEFVDLPSNITGIRSVPKDNEEIKSYMKKRCPMNQVSVMFRKEDVEKAGGYIDWYCEEDYYLWIRMLEKGFIFENIQEVLVNVRTGNEMASRRGGWKYFASEFRLQEYMLTNRIIGIPRFLLNVMLRFCGEVIVNSKTRQKLYAFLRTSKDSVKLSKNEKQGNNAEFDYPPFSVSMCVYGGDNAEWFDQALKSVIEQTVKPSEIVLVVDGPIPNSIQNVINKYDALLQ